MNENPAGIAGVQGLAKSDLVANAKFAGLPIFLELDEEATPDELAAFEKEFDRALLSFGVAVVITSPALVAISSATTASVTTQLGVAVAICENPEVNRGAADPLSDPPRTPANKSCRELLEAAIVALLPHFTFPPQEVGRAEWDVGFWTYYLVAQKRHVIRAASPSQS